ncbi:MAG: hypothetical protein COA78_15750 [Blastopirellula sp.]|nr:MAG: hypothetical protein COA78_15750 [Blastopirellula sp.]
MKRYLPVLLILVFGCNAETSSEPDYDQLYKSTLNEYTNKATLFEIEKSKSREMEQRIQNEIDKIHQTAADLDVSPSRFQESIDSYREILRSTKAKNAQYVTDMEKNLREGGKLLEKYQKLRLEQGASKK